MASVNFTLFSQIIQKIDKQIFKKLVKERQSDKYCKGLDSWTHFCSMLFCHFSKAHSLREISNGLRARGGNINHIGVLKAPAKSTLGYANGHRHWQLFEHFYYSLQHHLQGLGGYQKVKFRIKSKIYLLDSTTISLCLSLFDWARYRRQKGAIKLHTVLDYDTCLPAFVHLTDARVHDVKAAQDIILPRGSVVVADRAYQDFGMLWQWHIQGVRFVVRLKSNILVQTVKQNPLPPEKDFHILKDEIVQLQGINTTGKYPAPLRKVIVYDPKTEKEIEVVTNVLSWTASTISDLYKARWQVEIFFKEIKQHLSIKSFVGTSQNAVLIQIWTAMSTILLLKYLKAIAKYKWCLSNLVAFLRMSLFARIDLQNWLDKPFEPPPEIENTQLHLF